MTEQTERTRVSYAARRSGLSPATIRRCVRLGLVDESLREEDLVELRRIRRLRELEVNQAGAEIIVRMRRRIVSLQLELRELQYRDGPQEKQGV